MTLYKQPPDAIATSVWIECAVCKLAWLVPRWKAREVPHYIGPCCRDNAVPPVVTTRRMNIERTWVAALSGLATHRGRR